jgi:hypothetical protein
VENFLNVQYVPPRSTQRSKKIRTNTELSALSTVKPHSSMTALRSAPRKFRLKRRAEISAHHAEGRTACGRQAHAAPHTKQLLPKKPVPKMKDPSGGTTGRVKPYGALGVDGRSRRIQPMGRDYRSHIDKSQHPRRTFKTPDDFFDLVFAGDCRKIAAQQAISRRFRPIYPPPSTAGCHSAPGSRKRYRQTGQAPAFFLPRACRKPRQAELPAPLSPQ